MKDTKAKRCGTLRKAALSLMTGFGLAVLPLSASAGDDSDSIARMTDRELVRAAMRAVQGAAQEMEANGSEAQPLSTGPSKGRIGVRLTAAVSMSLEKDYRQALKHDAAKAGMRLAVRGLPVPDGFEGQPFFAAPKDKRVQLKGEIVRATAALHEAFGEIDVDPAFFRENGIEAAPVFVLEDDAGVIARVHGAVTTRYALEVMWSELTDAKSFVVKKAGKVRVSQAKEAVLKAGCALSAGTLAGLSFMGEACE